MTPRRPPFTAWPRAPDTAGAKSLTRRDRRSAPPDEVEPIFSSLPSREVSQTEAAKNSDPGTAGNPVGTEQAGKMKPETGRLEKRLAIAVPVRIASLDRRWLVERATTENVSLFGARILVKSMWRTNERAVVEAPGGIDPCEARVIYIASR